MNSIDDELNNKIYHFALINVSIAELRVISSGIIQLSMLDDCEDDRITNLIGKIEKEVDELDKYYFSKIDQLESDIGLKTLTLEQKENLQKMIDNCLNNIYAMCSNDEEENNNDEDD